jgi:signal transduction histidine kinase
MTIKNTRKKIQYQPFFRLINAIKSSSVILKSDGEIIIINDAWKDFADSEGLTWSNYALGKNYFETFDLLLESNPKEYKQLTDGFQKIAQNEKEEFKFEYPCHSPSKKRWFVMRATRFKYKKELYFLVIHYNITKRKLAEKADKFKKDLLAHDFANILNGIQASVGLMEMSKNESRARDERDDVLNIIKKQIDRGRSLISNVQLLSELESRGDLIKPVKVKDMLSSAIELTSSRFHEKPLKIHTEFPQEDIYAKGGEFLLNAFENILLNACIHNDNDVVFIWVSLSTIQEKGNILVQIEFKDNARGISEKRKKIICQRNYKEHLSSSGMGIGLSLVKKIISGYGGYIRVENRIKDDYKKGSNFILFLQKT